MDGQWMQRVFDAIEQGKRQGLEFQPARFDFGKIQDVVDDI
jgi:hypothetical protein